MGGLFWLCRLVGLSQDAHENFVSRPAGLGIDRHRWLFIMGRKQKSRLIVRGRIWYINITRSL
jgi:hypothetical protein